MYTHTHSKYASVPGQIAPGGKHSSIETYFKETNEYDLGKQTNEQANKHQDSEVPKNQIA